MKRENLRFNARKVFFTADTHFNHGNIVRICKRPFADVKEMNEQLIINWNRKVPKDADVFVLGDFMLCGASEWRNIIKQLNGRIHLILGNHCYQNARAIDESTLTSIHDQVCIQIIEDSQYLMLNHYPLLTWGGIERGTWNLHGHYHSQPGHRLQHSKPNQYDVGVDGNNFEPLSYEEVRYIIKEQLANPNRNDLVEFMKETLNKE